jgi:hypothetical protein
VCYSRAISRCPETRILPGVRHNRVASQTPVYGGVWAFAHSGALGVCTWCAPSPARVPAVLPHLPKMLVAQSDEFSAYSRQEYQIWSPST